MSFSVKVKLELNGEVLKLQRIPSSYQDLIETVQTKFSNRLQSGFELQCKMQSPLDESIESPDNIKIINSDIDLHQVLSKQIRNGCQTLKLKILPISSPKLLQSNNTLKNSQQQFLMKDHSDQKQIEKLIKILLLVKINPQQVNLTLGEDEDAGQVVQQFEKLFDHKLRTAYKMLFNTDIQKNNKNSDQKQSEGYFIHFNHECNACLKKPIIGNRFQNRENPAQNYCCDCAKSMNQTALKLIENYEFNQDFVTNKLCDYQINRIVKKKYKVKSNQIVNVCHDKKMRSLPYKCNLMNKNPQFFTVHPGDQIKSEFTLMNNGCVEFPNDVKLYCVSGQSEGQSIKIDQLDVNESTSVSVKIQAPQQRGNYESVWRLATRSVGFRKCFGPKLNIFMRVSGNKSENQPERSVHFNNIIENNIHSNNETQLKAKEIQSLIGGNVQTIVNLIKAQRLEDASVDDIMEMILN